MNAATPSPRTLDDLPLWRLLVALDDAEQTLGPHASTTRTLAAVVQRRLRRERPTSSPARRVKHGHPPEPEEEAG
jgi:hypothetical protein